MRVCAHTNIPWNCAEVRGQPESVCFLSPLWVPGIKLRLDSQVPLPIQLPPWLCLILDHRIC